MFLICCLAVCYGIETFPPAGQFLRTKSKQLEIALGISWNWPDSLSSSLLTSTAESHSQMVQAAKQQQGLVKYPGRNGDWVTFKGHCPAVVLSIGCALCSRFPVFVSCYPCCGGLWGWSCLWFVSVPLNNLSTIFLWVNQ